MAKKLVGGANEDVCKRLGVSPQTFYRCKRAIRRGRREHREAPERTRERECQTQEIGRQEGLKVRRKKRPKHRRGSTSESSQLKRVSCPNHVWSYDFVFDETEGGKRQKWLAICDEFTRESMALEVELHMTAQDVVRILDQAVEERGSVLEYIRSDNGPEFIAKAVVDWVVARGFKTLFIEPGSPWQNCYSESFNSRFRDEFLNVVLFGTLLEAKLLGREFRNDYNHERAHSLLGYLPPAEYAVSCREKNPNQAELSGVDQQMGHSIKSPVLMLNIYVPSPDSRFGCAFFVLICEESDMDELVSQIEKVILAAKAAPAKL